VTQARDCCDGRGRIENVGKRRLDQIGKYRVNENDEEIFRSERICSHAELRVPSGRIGRVVGKARSSSPSLRAKRSNPSHSKKKSWIASSLRSSQ
jgi:hypothetical protein